MGRITVKEKPCKGTGLAKGYGCGTITVHRKYGLCKATCYPDWLLNSENGKIKMQKATLKATKERKELEQAREQKNSRKSLTTLLESVKQVFHEYVRERDKHKPCISSGNPWQSNHDAGHFFKSELYPRLRFHEWNVHGQSILDNRMKDGNFQGYSERLPDRIGQDKYDKLVKLAEYDKKTPYKWDREELKQIRTKYRNKLKELKDGKRIK